MDWSHFGMARPAFRPSVDTDAYFPAGSHETARAAVAAAFARREPVVLIDGPPGIGKSLVARKWLEHLLPDVPRALLPNIHAARPADLLQAILFDLNQPYQGHTEQELRLGVTAQLLAAAETGFPLVLVVDEAHHLSRAALEELRLLGNVENRGGCALFVVLVANPTLRAAIHRPAYEEFAQRVAARCAVEPLSVAESAGYLRHQVAAAGGDPGAVLDDGAVSLLAEACGGVPRVLNQAAALAAALAAEAGADTIDVEAALEAFTRLGLDVATAETGEPDVLPHPARTAKPAPADAVTEETEPARTGPDEPTTARGPKDKPARKRAA